MYIKPYSDPSLYVPGGKCEPVAANFPCLRFWLKCTEKSPSINTVRDAISGAAPTIVNNVTGNGVSFSIAPGGSILFASVPSMVGANGTRVAVAFSVHNFTSGATGDINFSEPGGTVMDINNTSSVISDETNTASMTGMTIGSLKGVALIFTPGSSNQGLKIEGDLSTAFPAGTPVSSTPGAMTFILKPTIFSILTSAQPALVYGVTYMTFGSGLPSNFRAGLNWMLAQWTNNIPALPVATYGKLIYPGFRGLAG
jgi:hypothetical protein